MHSAVFRVQPASVACAWLMAELGLQSQSLATLVLRLPGAQSRSCGLPSPTAADPLLRCLPQPPYLATAASLSLKRIQENAGSWVPRLASVAHMLRSRLAGVKGLQVSCCSVQAAHAATAHPCTASTFHALAMPAWPMHQPCTSHARSCPAEQLSLWLLQVLGSDVSPLIHLALARPSGSAVQDAQRLQALADELLKSHDLLVCCSR